MLPRLEIEEAKNFPSLQLGQDRPSFIDDQGARGESRPLERLALPLARAVFSIVGRKSRYAPIPADVGPLWRATAEPQARRGDVPQARRGGEPQARRSNIPLLVVRARRGVRAAVRLEEVDRVVEFEAGAFERLDEHPVVRLEGEVLPVAAFTGDPSLAAPGAFAEPRTWAST